MPILLGRHYRMLSAAFSLFGEQGVQMLVSVFFDPANRQGFAPPCTSKHRSAGVSNSLCNDQQSVAGGAFTHHSRLRRITDRSSHSS
ncbi:hypothetical protein SADFL11_00030180 [Roseibium alexandrii DFL-11]|uniref:Uncharacterized protein n=1 Tax=Roseibium alexandrii (strain DSM 17067 / NCIMB 14079 / DFL-11) TaxID=244592 RepID=A0A5E8UWT2_ROSAD|nr:hypothetical protein SADFL11_00030180 [Roseibium alexandrii DFL-11]